MKFLLFNLVVAGSIFYLVSVDKPTHRRWKTRPRR